MIDKKTVVKKEYMRAREIADNYPIGMSTIWNWASKGKLTAIKVSDGMTVFKLSELEELFSPIQKASNVEITVNKKRLRRIKSNRLKLRKKRITRIAKQKELNSIKPAVYSQP